MTDGIRGPCQGCRERSAVCHGRTEDGAWRCSRWAAYQSEREAYRARTAEDFGYTSVALGYKRERALRNAKRLTGMERRR